MRANLVATLTCSLSFGAPLLWAVLELIYLRRGGGWRPERVPDEDSPRPLPPCLLIPPLPMRPMVHTPRPRELVGVE